jgi:hypothetical protein
MRLMPRQSGPRARAETSAARKRWEREWVAAEALDRAEAARAAPELTRGRVVPLALLALLAGLLAGIFPLTPGFSAGDVLAAAVAAVLTATVSVAVVQFADRVGRGLRDAGAGDRLVFAAALASVGAAAIHFSVAKMHFEEYGLFGVFFVGSATAQLVWPLWLLLRRWPPLLVLGAIGNALIVALWLVDRIWGVPLGPDPWTPDPFGFGDSVASGFEATLVICCIALVVRRRGGALGRRSTLALTFGAVALITLSLLSVLGVASSVLTPTQ